MRANARGAGLEIAICGGGRTFTFTLLGRTFTQAERESVGVRSDELAMRIHAAFSAAFSRARVDLIDEVSPDADFYLLATAPMLVTAAGSYALAASLVSRDQRLTRALKNVNFVHKGWTKTTGRRVVPGDSRCWQIYNDVGSRRPL